MPPLVIPSLARDLYANIVIIIIEILRLRFAPLRMTRKGRARRGSAQDDGKEARGSAQDDGKEARGSAQDDTEGAGALSVQGDKEGHPYFYNAAANIRLSLKSRKFLSSLLKEIS